MAELNKQEIQSPELQEVMTEIPGSFLRWGLLIFFAIILILVAGSYFIKNPEVVAVPVVMTARNPPVALVAKSGGEIAGLRVTEGSTVKEGDIVAIIGNSADYADVLELGRMLEGFGGGTDWTGTVGKGEIPPDLSLGDIQSGYIQFQKGWKQLKDYIDQAYIPHKIGLLEKQIENKEKYNLELSRQKEIMEEDLMLAKKSFERDSILSANGTYTLSLNEYERSRQAYLQKLYSNSSFNASLINNGADFLRMKESGLDLEAQYRKELRQYSLSMEESLELLRISLIQWEERYVIKSPVAGSVSLGAIRNELQTINAGETLATIIPDTPADIVVRALIPVSGFAKVEVGQDVNIKLSGFPDTRYGVLKGRVISLSRVPGEGGFSADIELTDGMTSTYKEKIRFIYQMDGTADIITKDVRLINNFIGPLKGIIRN